MWLSRFHLQEVIENHLNWTAVRRQNERWCLIYPLPHHMSRHGFVDSLTQVSIKLRHIVGLLEKRLGPPSLLEVIVIRRKQRWMFVCTRGNCVTCGWLDW